MKKFYYVTTPIYYVNDKPHIGHCYTNLAADILARFKKLDNYTTIFLTGTDEHGQKVEKSAKDKNKDPQVFVDEVSDIFKKLAHTLHLTNNDFIRTTEQRHKTSVSFLWQELEKNGYIYLGKYNGWYAIRDEAFYNEEELVKNPEGKFIAPTGADVEWKEEECYFFKLSAFQEPLIEYYKNNPDCIAPKSRYNEVVSFVKAGLKDLAVSRTSFSWGIPVPQNEKHVIYVWLDALTNYISALGYPKKDSPFQNYWHNVVHIVGKDIIRFHSVYWFAFLMGVGITPPKRVFAHGWWLNEGQKISKSLGNVIDPNDLIAKYGLDALRYFLFKEVNFGNDGDFSHKSMVNRINNELANEYGNLLQRTITIIHKNFDGLLIETNLNEKEEEYLLKTNEVLNSLRNFIDGQELLKYIDTSWELIRYANAYINDQAPWKMIKEGKTQEAARILYFVCEILRRVSLMLNPYMPDATEKILKQLNVDKKQMNFANFNTRFVKNHKLNTPEIIFQKIIEEEKDGNNK